MEEEPPPPTFIRHRAGNPENTWTAIKRLLDESLYNDKNCSVAMELDLRKTNDGEVVIFHDKDLRRVTGNAYEKEIREMTWEELKDVKILGDERIPLLRDVLPKIIEFAKRYGRHVFIKFDLKDPITEELRDVLENNIHVFGENKNITPMIYMGREVSNEHVFEYWRKAKSRLNMLLEVPGESPYANDSAVDVICYDVNDPSDISKIERPKSKKLDVYIDFVNDNELQKIVRGVRSKRPDMVTVDYRLNYEYVERLWIACSPIVT